jgi:hypothetical protein
VLPATTIPWTYPYSDPLANDLTVYLQHDAAPYFLLTAVVILFVALSAVFWEKIRGRLDIHSLYCLALFVGFLLFTACCIMSATLVVSLKLSGAESANSYCDVFVSKTWTPQYTQSLIEKYSAGAEKTIENSVSGPRADEESREYVRIVGVDFLKHRFLSQALDLEAKKLQRSCVQERFKQSGLPDDSFIQGVYFVLLSIVFFLFSRLVFTREKFKLAVMEKGAIFAGTLLWVWGIFCLFEVYYYGVNVYGEIGQSIRIPLILGELVLAAYWLGWRHSFLKKKQQKTKE